MHEDSEELCHIPGDAFPELHHIPVALDMNEQMGSTAPADTGRQSSEYQHRGSCILNSALVLTSFRRRLLRFCNSQTYWFPIMRLCINYIGLRKGRAFTGVVIFPTEFDTRLVCKLVVGQRAKLKLQQKDLLWCGQFS